MKIPLNDMKTMLQLFQNDDKTKVFGFKRSLQKDMAQK